jgi:hypothetical protein
MYGKRRITITDRQVIVLAGNKSWIPIGRFIKTNNQLIGRLRDINSFDPSLNDTNSIEFRFDNITELRTFVKEQYKTKL